MNEPNENPRRYKWPSSALAAVVLFTVLAIFWVALAAKKVEQQRDFGSPLPSTPPAR